MDLAGLILGWQVLASRWLGLELSANAKVFHAEHSKSQRTGLRARSFTCRSSGCGTTHIMWQRRLGAARFRNPS